MRAPTGLTNDSAGPCCLDFDVGSTQSGALLEENLASRTTLIEYRYTRTNLLWRCTNAAISLPEQGHPPHSTIYPGRSRLPSLILQSLQTAPAKVLDTERAILLRSNSRKSHLHKCTHLTPTPTSTSALEFNFREYFCYSWSILRSKPGQYELVCAP